MKCEEATLDNYYSAVAHLHDHPLLHPSPPPPPIHGPPSSLHSSSSSFHRWAHSACSISQQPRRVGVIPTVPGGAVAGPPTRFHLPLLAPRSGNLQTRPFLAHYTTITTTAPSPPPEPTGQTAAALKSSVCSILRARTTQPLLFFRFAKGSTPARHRCSPG